MTARLLATGFGAAAISLVATPVAMVVARRIGVVDHPGPLKPQQAAVPYLGGAAVALAVVVGGAFGRAALLIPLAMAAALGVADDVRHLTPGLRLVGQVAVGVVTAALLPDRLPGLLGPVLVVFVTVLLMNGVNMIDGLDGLAGGVVMVGAVAFAWLLRGDPRLLGVALACALAGFLVYNRPPARIYLGDGGAYLLGTGLAILLASSWEPGRRLPVAVASLLIVALPVAEVAFVIVRRLRSGRSIVLGDRGHPYDRLTAKGWPTLGASLLYVAVEAALAAVALAVAKTTSAVPAVIAAVLVAAALIVAGAATHVLSPDGGSTL